MAILIVELPLLSVIEGDVYVPLVSITVPVGVGLLPPPLTVTVTVSACMVLMLEDDGETMTVGVTFGLAAALLRKAVTSSDPSPVTWSKPTANVYPGVAAAVLTGAGMLLLQILVVFTSQVATPLVATVASWNTPGLLAASP